MRKLFLFMIIDGREEPCGKESSIAFANLSAKSFNPSVSSGEGIHTRIVFLLILAGFVGLKLPSLLRTCSCI